MLRINNRGFKRSYVYGGTGIFDSIAKAAVSLLPVVQKGALQVGKKLGEKGVQKVSSLVSKSRDKPSKSEETKLITFRSGPKDPERSFAGPLYPERSLQTYFKISGHITKIHSSSTTTFGTEF